MKSRYRYLALLLALIIFVSGSNVQTMVYAENTNILAIEETEKDLDIQTGEEPEKEEAAKVEAKEEETEIIESEEMLPRQPEERKETDTTSEAKEETKQTDAQPIENGYLLIGIIGGGDYIPDQEMNLEVNYKPSVNGTEKYIDFSGFQTLGINITEAVSSETAAITKVDTTENSMKVYFEQTLDSTKSISFRFKVKVSDEKLFCNAVAAANGKVTGITAKEFVDNKVNQSIQTDFNVSYVMKTGDVHTVESPKEKPGDIESRFYWGMALFTKAKNVDALDGSGWLSKETEYVLQAVSPRALASRYIQDMVLEIPLPNNVKYIDSAYEEEKDGITIQYDDLRHYIILSCKEYDGRKKQQMKFTMQLDYTGVGEKSGTAAKQVDYWHNFYINTNEFPDRNEYGRPWKFSGKIYGVSAEQEFYDRSKIVLDTVALNYRSVMALRFKILDYGKEITGAGLQRDGIYNQTGIRGDGFMYSAGELGAPGYTKEISWEFDQPIKVRKITSKYEFPDDIQIKYVTNKSREIVKTKKDMYKETNAWFIDSPTIEKGEYIKNVKIISQTEVKQSYMFIVDLLTKDENGQRLPVNTISYISLKWSILEYGISNSGGLPLDEEGKQRIPAAKYIGAEMSVPSASVVGNGGEDNSNDLTNTAFFLLDKRYENINLLSVHNNVETSTPEIVDWSTVNVSHTLTSGGPNKEPNFLYQMLSNSPGTIELEGYGDVPPDVTFTFGTNLTGSKEVVIPSDAFTEKENKWSAKVDFALAEGEYLNSQFNTQISFMPANASFQLKLDYFQIENGTLPSGTKVESLPSNEVGTYQDVRTWWKNIYVSVSAQSSSGMTKTGLTLSKQAYLYKDPVLMFSRINFFDEGDKIKKSIYQGGETTISFALEDVAFNPTYAIEIDKQFNYIPGSFKGKNTAYKITEEWLPGFFNDPADTDHYGNGLLKIRFIGGQGEAYNLFPVKIQDPFYKSNTSGQSALNFNMKVQAKLQASPGSYAMIRKVYRMDDWAIQNLVGKNLAVGSWYGYGISELSNVSVRKLVNKTPTYYNQDYSPSNQLIPTYETDKYDVNGNGSKTDTIMYTTERSDDTKQPITKVASTRVDGYLVDPQTGTELRTANLYPHQVVDFVQLMELVSDQDGSDFIGYYHIPKKGHHIDYADETGKVGTYESEFDTELKDFISTTVDGIDITNTGKIEVYYFVSDNPADLSDGHNNMNELVDGQTDNTANYKTETQIRAMASNDRELAEILSRVTMIKIKASVIERNKLIISKTKLGIGHKAEGDGTLQDYFSGIYRYTNGAARIPKQYTTLMTFNMLDYDIKGTIWKDKNADSLLSPSESGMGNIEVQLWSTGEDPHGGPTTEPYKLTSVKTESDGSFSLKQGYHGNYFLQFEIPEKMMLSFPNKTGGQPYEQSVFTKVTDPDTNKTYARAYFTLDDKSYLYQNGGLVDERSLNTPEDIYLSVGETLPISYKITPDYLMNEELFKITPEITSDVLNNTYFTVDNSTQTLKGMSEGEGVITVRIPASPLDGSTYINKTVKVHVEPESVASVSVPTKVEIYAVQGKTNEVIAPELTLYNYDKDEVKAYIKGIDQANTGQSKTLTLSEKKTDYSVTEISLNIIPVERANPFSAVTKTNLKEVAYIKGGLLLGSLQSFEKTGNWGKFTLNGEYNAQIVKTDLKDNCFVMRYRFEK